MILRQGFLLLLLLLLLKSTKSHPTQKRDTSSVSISKPSQNVINDGNPVNSEPASFSPHTVSPSYYHPKEAIGHPINVHKFHNWRTMSSMIVGSSNSASPEQKKIELGEVPPDTTNVEALTVLDDSSMNSQADPNETSLTKSVKSSFETVPAIAKRAMDFKLPKWNFKGWRGWNGLKGVTRRFGGATQGTQKAQNMQKLEGSQAIQPGQISRNNMPNKGIKINNGRKVGSRLRKGVRVGRVRAAGRKGTRVGQRNKDEVVKGNSPVALPAIKSDNSVVSNAPVKVASGKKNLKRPIFESDDSQTEGYARNRNSRSKDSFHNPPGFSEFSNVESDTLSRTRNKGKKNRNSITPNFKTEDYYSSSDSGKSDSSSSFDNPGSANSAQYWTKNNINTPTTDSRPLEIKLVKSENQISPDHFSLTGDEKPSGADPSANIQTNPTNIQNGDMTEKNMEVPRFRDVQLMNQRDGVPHGENGHSDSEDELKINYNQRSNPRNFRRPHFEDDMDMNNYHMQGGGGGNFGTNTGHKIANAIGNFLPIAQTIGNVVTGRGNMGYGVGGYGGGYDDMDHMAGYGGAGAMGGYGGGGAMGGYGGGGAMGGYGGGGGYGGYGGGAGMGGYGSHGAGVGAGAVGFGGAGYGASGLGGGGVGNPGADELGGDDIGGDPLDDLLDESLTKTVEKSTKNSISNIKKSKDESKVANVANEKDHEIGEKDTHHDRSSDHLPKKLKIDSKKKNDTITIDNDKTKNKVSSQNNAKAPNGSVTRLDV